MSLPARRSSGFVLEFTFVGGEIWKLSLSAFPLWTIVVGIGFNIDWADVGCIGADWISAVDVPPCDRDIGVSR